MEKKGVIIPVASGKGGTGKSFFSANLGIALANRGQKVIIIDGDLGGANLHNFLQVKKPKASLTNFFLKENSDLNEIALKTRVQNLNFIASGAIIFGITNIPYFKKMQLLRKINDLEADYTIIDLGGGIDFNTLDLFNLSNTGLIVINPEPNSQQNSLVFLKSALFRKIINTVKENKEVYDNIKKEVKENPRQAFNINTILTWVILNSMEMSEILRSLLNEYKPKLIMNKVRKNGAEQRAIEIIDLLKKHLQIETDYLGAIKYDSNVEEAVLKSEIFLNNYTYSPATRNIYDIASNIIHNDSYFTNNFISKIKKRFIHNAALLYQR